MRQVRRFPSSVLSGDAFEVFIEFAMEMETGPAHKPVAVRRPRTLYERAPLQFWQGVAGLLGLALLVSLLRHGL